MYRDSSKEQEGPSIHTMVWVNLKIFLHLLKRDPRYLVVFLPMYGWSFKDPLRGHHLRSAYCFARQMDDLLDEDIPTPDDTNPGAYVRRALDRIRDRSIPLGDSDLLALLGRYVFDHIGRYSNDAVNLCGELDTLIQAMLFDRRRMESRQLLSQEQLDRHHLETFHSALNITLCITGSSYRPEQIIPLAVAQGSLYSLRDLEQDLALGICNIPEPVLRKTGLEPAVRLEYGQLADAGPFRLWASGELARGREHLARFRETLSRHENHRFKITLNSLVRGLTYLSGKLEKKYYCSRPSSSHELPEGRAVTATIPSKTILD